MEHELLWNGYTICPPAWGMSNVSEVFHRVYYVYGGNAYYRDAEGTRRFLPGHLYVLPVLMPYTTWHDPASPLDVLWFHVETPLRLCTRLWEQPVEEGTLLHHLLEGLRQLSEDVEQLPLLRQVFSVLLSVLAEQSSTTSRQVQDMQPVLDYIDAHPDQALQVDQLARFAGMDRSYFSRKFKSLLNISPNKYLLHQRMKAAARALTAGASVAEAAAACGYRDEKAFSRAFKRYMEVSPAHYRDHRTPQP